MVLAAGLGTRMRPLTDRMPKPLVPLAGRALIDHVLDRLAAAGIRQAVVNVHYIADQIEAHVRQPAAARDQHLGRARAVLDTGGGVKRALGLLGEAPFLVHNSDTVWIEARRASNIARLIAALDAARMDCLLLLADRATASATRAAAISTRVPTGACAPRVGRERPPYVFAGVSIMAPRLLRERPKARSRSIACGTGRWPRARLWPRARGHLDACRRSGGAGRG